MFDIYILIMRIEHVFLGRGLRAVEDVPVA